ncbi:hypothetical protein [Acidilobus sp. 7A]|uniref:hypothetical protein n=1 Tax=Acidilobus sp. 7A TaxID=1577685 RepID=UPI000764EB33|nr:hypothetical protein [Acidilobus sp. 7A]AMD30784.1 hypothetical protein SE86_05195 [Acidilobus sp. 7A]
MRLSLRLPVILIGLPMEGVENPYLVAPGDKVRVEAEYSECDSRGLRAEGLQQDVAERLGEFWRKLMDGLGMGGCANLRVDGMPPRWPASGVYAAMSSALLYLTARSHADTLDELEIVEMGRMSDPWGEGSLWWQGALDAMRYSAATGKAVAYRNDEESVELSDEGVRAELMSVSAVGGGAGRQELGESLFDAVVHMVGQAVLDASDAIRSGSHVRPEALRRARVQNATAYLVYGVAPPQEGSCVWSPGLPGQLQLVCITG